MKPTYRFLLVAVFLLVPGAAAFGQGDALPQLPGFIAYVGSDYNIYSLNLQDGSSTALTDDAARQRRYQWPTWATDGRLAYFMSGVDRNGGALLEVHVSQDGLASGDVIYSSQDEFFTYAYWSPGNCDEGDNCRDLAILLNSQAQGGLFVEMARDGAEPSSRTIGRGSPFYYSWSPDGSQMLWQRNNLSMDIYDAASDAVAETLPQRPGVFQAPAWSPVDDRLLFGAIAEDRSGTDLIIVSEGEVQTLAAGLSGQLAFAWSPDGTKVAYTTQPGPLTVLDAATGDVLTQSEEERVPSFFWSPDSQQVAFITLVRQSRSADGAAKIRLGFALQEVIGIAWSVLDVEDGTTRTYAPFLPTQEMLYELVFFDQFAQSHRVWSPDSRYLVYSETTADNRSVINVLDVSQEGSEPTPIAEGFIGIWSFE